MSELLIKRFSAPDERRPFAGHGHADILQFDEGRMVGLLVLEPGWKWSEDVKPIAGTESCQTAHALYVISGRMVVKMDDGTQGELGPGDVATISPGHDAWVLGNEPCLVVDFEGMGAYARREATRTSQPGITPESAPGLH
ncbi:cupin domain-containing protein [Myxococcus sp. AM011]|uniref:cupin domain-containing protein n=1 Tax=Myxococcus sp. AM011 TaxID=2745200 RepID=UPI001595DA4A|nr:cupin domain-containing protein [Myxococcus sp. AM011]NVJ24134.1 cupin domain-containing protein [Myxococcus sp. AM011]